MKEFKDLTFEPIFYNKLYSHKALMLFHTTEGYDYLLSVKKFKNEDNYNAELYVKEFSGETTAIKAPWDKTPHKYDEKFTVDEITHFMLDLQQKSNNNNLNMVTFEVFNKFPIDTQNKIIECVFAANIPSEIDRIKKDIINNGSKSEFSEVLLENIKLKYSNISGKYYEVTGLFHVPQRAFGVDLEEDNN